MAVVVAVDGLLLEENLSVDKESTLTDSSNDHLQISHEQSQSSSQEKNRSSNGISISHHENCTDDNEIKINPAALARICMAATLVRDAKSNRFIQFRTDAQSLKYYQAYYNSALKWIQYFIIFVMLSLALFEEPAVWPVSYWVLSVIEIVCLAYLTFRVVHLASFQHKADFWKDRKNIVAIVLIMITFIDIVSYSLWKEFAGDKNPVRWSRPLRPLFIINFPHARQIRRAFRNIRRTIVEIIFVLILFFFSILLFSLLALKLVGSKGYHTRDGGTYFASYWDAMWNLYVLVTTANNPDVMMPAYDASNWYALFFIVFLVINLYIFMNVLLAVIFNGYKKHLKNEVKDTVYAKRRKLAKAFELVQEFHNGNNYLSFQTWKAIVRVMAPKRSDIQVKMLFQVMDSDNDGKLTKADFMMAGDLLNVPLTEIKDRMILWEKLFPRFYNSQVSDIIRQVIRHKMFRYFFDFAILVNAVFIALEQEKAEWFFLALFTLEILLKMYAYGIYGFFTQFWNVFDIVVIGGAMVATIVEASTDETSLQGETLDFILVVRVLRLIKIVNGIHRFRIVIMTLVNIGPSIIIYGGVLFTFYYSFAIIGMEVFHGKITYYGYNMSAQQPEQYYCGAAALNNSEFYKDHYCSNNFNHIAKAFVILTELTVVNQWHVLTKGFELVTHKAVRIYFLFFHLMVVVLIMNIFIAFILEAFLLEYSLSKSKFESKIEAKILQLGYGLGQKKKAAAVSLPTQGDRKSIVQDFESIETISMDSETRFHVQQNKKKVEVLLQRMFEDELDPEDLGSQDSLDEESDKPGRKYTLDAMTEEQHDCLPKIFSLSAADSLTQQITTTKSIMFLGSTPKQKKI